MELDLDLVQIGERILQSYEVSEASEECHYGV
jgi:hypothetical protein